MYRLDGTSIESCFVLLNLPPLLTFDVQPVLDELFKRVNEFSGPFLMFGFIVDVVILGDGYFEYLQDFPYVSVLIDWDSSSGYTFRAHQVRLAAGVPGEEVSGLPGALLRPRAGVREVQRTWGLHSTRRVFT